MAIYFTSDLHFGHQNIIASCRPHFESVKEMNETLIRNWNNKVTDDDDVYILGDLAFRSEYHIGYYMSQLKGRKHLIIGNHDPSWMKNVKYMEEFFESVEYMTIIEYIPEGSEHPKRDKKILTLCHYPMLEWNGSRHFDRTPNYYLIHGHIHNTVGDDTYKYISKHLPHALNCGVDVNNYEPVTFEELLENNKKWYDRR